MAGYRRNFNPRSPHGERRPCRTTTFPFEEISIHAPRTGSDHVNAFIARAGLISIHAPRTGSDSRRSREPEGYQNFNPRSPHGERPAEAEKKDQKNLISIHAPRTGSDETQAHINAADA